MRDVLFKKYKNMFFYLQLALLSGAHFCASATELENKDEILDGTVRIRVWKAAKLSMGHVSLQTSKHYISFWPSDVERIEGTGGFPIRARGKFKESYNEDLKSEKDRVPEYDYFLFGLDTKQIDEFSTFLKTKEIVEVEIESKKEGKKKVSLEVAKNVMWLLPGDWVTYNEYVTLSKEENEKENEIQKSFSAFNCSTLTNELLSKGGLYKLYGTLKLDHMLRKTKYHYSQLFLRFVKGLSRNKFKEEVDIIQEILEQQTPLLEVASPEDIGTITEKALCLQSKIVITSDNDFKSYGLDVIQEVSDEVGKIKNLQRKEEVLKIAKKTLKRFREEEDKEQREYDESSWVNPMSYLRRYEWVSYKNKYGYN